MLSRLTFWWVQPLMVLGYKVKVELDDLLPLPQSLRMDSVGPAFYSTLQSCRQVRKRKACPDPRRPKKEKKRKNREELKKNRPKKAKGRIKRIRQSQQNIPIHMVTKVSFFSFLFISVLFYYYLKCSVGQRGIFSFAVSTSLYT
jgi:hypothetical protein